MSRVIEILLVEDNSGDVKLTSKMLSTLKTPHRLSIARDGIEATNFLLKENPYQEAPLPNLILLDLNLPKKDGREFLRDIKTDPRFKRIPVIVFTTSGAETDILMSYDLHANCYIKKPVSLEEFRHVIAAIETFWLQVAVVP